jgi:hypothetical protein
VTRDPRSSHTTRSATARAACRKAISCCTCAVPRTTSLGVRARSDSASRTRVFKVRGVPEPDRAGVEGAAGTGAEGAAVRELRRGLPVGVGVDGFLGWAQLSISPGTLSVRSLRPPSRDRPCPGVRHLVFGSFPPQPLARGIETTLRHLLQHLTNLSS